MDIPENNSLFKKLGLTKSISLELSMTAEEFKDKFKSKVGSKTSFFGFSNHDLEFHGEIKRSTFKIWRNATYFNNNDQTLANGSYLETENKLIVDLIIHPPILWIGMFCVIIVLVSTVPIIVTAKTNPDSFKAAVIICMSTLIVFPFFFFLPLINKVKKFLFDIQRELKTW